MQTRLYAPYFDSVCAMDFVHAGKKMRKGQPFPHAELKLNDTELRGLWLANYIEFVQPTAKSSSPPAKIKQAG